MYIATDLTSKKDKEDLDKVFKELDKNSDGKLSREELIEGYTKTYNDPIRAKEEVDRIIKDFAADSNDYIDYARNLRAFY